MAEVLFKDFYGRVKWLPDIVVNVRAQTPGKARASILKLAREAGYNAWLPDIQVRRGQWVTGVDVWA